jgi:hypothetical protein
MTQKNPTSTDSLIEQMTAGISPVKVRRPGWGTVFVWTAALLLIVISVAFSSAHLRGDFAEVHILAGVAGALLIAFGASRAGVSLLVPAGAAGLWPFAVMGTGLAVSVGGLLLSGPHSIGLHPAGFKCAATLSFYAVLPALALAFAARRFAPTDIGLLGAVIGAGAAAAGYGTLLLICPVSDVAHLAAYHLLPAIGISVGASVILAPLLRW